MKRLNFINVLKGLFHYKKVYTFSLLVTALFLTSCDNKSLKTGYIDINQINQEFTLAIKYEKHIRFMENQVASDLLGYQAEVNLLIDSISKMKKRGDDPSQDLLKEYYSKKGVWNSKKDLEVAKVQDSISIYREKLVATINEKVAEYGKTNGYHYVFSPSGSSAFMYGDSSLNITKEVIAYLNSK